jgi:hypothetical protein
MRRVASRRFRHLSPRHTPLREFPLQPALSLPNILPPDPRAPFRPSLAFDLGRPRGHRRDLRESR